MLPRPGWSAERDSRWGADPQSTQASRSGTSGRGEEARGVRVDTQQGPRTGGPGRDGGKDRQVCADGTPGAPLWRGGPGSMDALEQQENDSRSARHWE